MTKKVLIALAVAVLLCGLLTSSILADSSVSRNRAGDKRPENVSGFNINPYVKSGAEGTFDGEGSESAASSRRPLGATSTTEGEGIGESFARTFDDVQATWSGSRQTNHYYNGLTGLDAKVSVHFVYSLGLDTLNTLYAGTTDIRTFPQTRLTGYNVYDATVPGGDWPVGGQDVGCGFQQTDSIGRGIIHTLDMTRDGRAVVAAQARTRIFESDTVSRRVNDTRVYYQGSEFNCVFNPYTPINVSWLDSTYYRGDFLTPAGATRNGMYITYPNVVTQYDGANTIVHLTAIEGAFLPVPGYGDGNLYNTLFYFQKVGGYSGDGVWQEKQIIDTIDFVYSGLAAAEYPGTGVACIYSNPTTTGMTLNQPDADIFCRESTDRGVNWGTSYSITNYNNSIADLSKHYSAGYEVRCMYDSEGRLHAWWIAKQCSANPYTDGFNWTDWDGNLYHWEKTSDAVVKVANGTFLNPDMLGGSINPANCGYGGGNASYLAWTSMGECDGKLYMVWSQMHERANWNEWRDVVPQPAAGVLDDCAVDNLSNLYSRANWEILMSVARLESSSAWDYPRNISDTYRPGCYLAGAGEPICASEWHPQLEEFALDAAVEAGLSLSWPDAAKVDMTPAGFPAYDGDWYLNMSYLDDQWPGPAYWGGDLTTPRHNPPATFNSMKWIRLACVDPIEASRIAVVPEEIEWPEWVPLSTVEPNKVIVRNEGNVELTITRIGTFGGSWLTVSENPTALDPFVVPAGLIQTDSFYININGGTQQAWLEGYVWLKSDAVNTDSIVIPIRILAADTVEPVVWDTVATAQNMFHPFLAPQGACVGLAVGNMGELGWGGGSGGRATLDYTDARNMLVGRRECDTTIYRNRVYLVSATPFTLLANAGDGSGAELSQVFNDGDQIDDNGFDPTADKGSLTGGLTAGGAYDSAYTGRFVNRDTSIAMERIVYGPRSATPATDIINFVIVYTKVYSGDGLAHNHVTIGDAMDFDIPSDRPPYNVGGIVVDSFVYLRGTDVVGNTSCSIHAGRYATEAFGGGYTSVEFLADSCVNNFVYKGSRAAEQLIMVDTSHWGTTPVTPAQPNPLAWWNEASVGGLSLVEPIHDTGRDLALFLTYKYDYSLGALDTLHYWTVLTTTPMGGTLEELTAQVTYAKTWYMETVRGCGDGGCCVGRVGDANGSHEAEDEISLGDIMLMVDVLFISSDCSKLTCLEEADVTQSPGTPPLTCTNFTEYVTLGDIMTLVDHLFISNAPLKDCL